MNTNETHLLIATLPSSPAPYSTCLKSPQKNFRCRLYNLLCLKLRGHQTESHQISTRCTEMIADLVKSKLRSSNPFRNANVTMKIVVKLPANHNKNCAFNSVNSEIIGRKFTKFASAFDNGLAYRKSAFKRLNGNNQTTSYPNLLNFCPIISEFTLLKRLFLPRFARNLTTIFIRQVGVSKRIGRSQFWFQQSNLQSFLYILQKFGEIGFSDPGV